MEGSCIGREDDRPQEEHQDDQGLLITKTIKRMVSAKILMGAYPSSCVVCDRRTL